MQTVVTHSGSFDPDDVLAVAAVQLYLGVDEVNVVRSRDQEVIGQADWVIDVGGEYDVATYRFDHHQNGVPERESGIPYSAFGLVWREFGESICGSIEVADQIEERWVLPIDAADNHITVCQSRLPDVVPLEFFDVIDAFKPVWGSDETYNSQFVEAVDFARHLLKRMIARTEGQLAMQERIQFRYEESEEKAILVFDEPVARHDFVEFQEAKVVVSPVHATDVGGWMAAVIPEDSQVFQNRVEFPREWAGLVNEELASVSGIEGAIFCHKECYVFVAENKEAALEAAEHALKEKL